MMAADSVDVKVEKLVFRKVVCSVVYSVDVKVEKSDDRKVVCSVGYSVVVMAVPLVGL